MAKMQGRPVHCALLLLINDPPNYGNGCRTTAIKMVHSLYCLVMCCTRSLYHLGWLSTIAAQVSHPGNSPGLQLMSPSTM